MFNKHAHGISAIVFALLFLGCASGDSSDSDNMTGCDEDTDCASGRICMDAICIYQEDKDIYQPAARIAENIIISLKDKSWGKLLVSQPTEYDMDWGFDWVDQSGEQYQQDYSSKEAKFWLDYESRLGQVRQRLQEQWSLVLQNGFNASEFKEFRPGESSPIPQGSELAIRPLDSLINSQIIYTDLENQEQVLQVKRLIRLRGRWLLFDLTD